MKILIVAAMLATLAGGAAAQVVVPQPVPSEAPGPARKGDPAQGRIIADRWCAECHVVRPDQTSAKADVPTFSAIARKGISDADLQRFLMAPHPRMPDMQIGRAEAADLVAYIDSQKP